MSEYLCHIRDCVIGYKYFMMKFSLSTIIMSKSEIVFILEYLLLDKRFLFYDPCVFVLKKSNLTLHSNCEHAKEFKETLCFRLSTSTVTTWFCTTFFTTWTKTLRRRSESVRSSTFGSTSLGVEWHCLSRLKTKLLI